MVAEPPWINHNSGVAPRNGTTTHTIPFGFTSTSGSELVFVVGGPVTHTVAGWNEMLQPVASGELSVFTKTSAGESSVTVTHNASDSTVAWAVYELPAGATWFGAGQELVASSDTFPTASGLPGTAVVVWAARSRNASSAATGASSTWDAPWVEDADLYANAATNDGTYLTVGHQINVTATSVTPTAVTTYSGTWAAADREHVVFALTVPAVADTTAPSVPTGLAVTAVGSTTVDLTWNASTDNVGVTGYEVVVIGP